MGCVSMGHSISPSSPVDPSSCTYVVGIDIGSQTCSFCVLKPDTSQVIKPTDFANAPAGCTLLLEKLERVEVPPEQILIGLEATSRDARESLPLSGKSRLAALEARIHGKPISVRNNGDCERKRIDCMRIPSHGCCEAARLVVGMCQRT
jgi:hypothetical protein